MDTSAIAAPGSPEKTGKRPWLRATIKTSHSSGSPVVDWSKVQLNFRVYKSNAEAAVAASIVARVDNHMETSTLSGLILRLKDHGDISIGNFDMKGTLVTDECSVPVKLSLPVAMHFSPVEGLALEDVAQQLASTQWSSHSTKLEITSAIGHEKLKPLLCGFLRMAEVEPDTSGPTAGTFAGQSTSGAQVRILVKVKKNSLKVDVKCTNPHLGKILISDLKRLVL
jgi:hypothetical protein